MDYDVELTYRLSGERGGITAAFKLAALTDDPETGVEQARDALDGIIGSALDGADLVKVEITETPTK